MTRSPLPASRFPLRGNGMAITNHERVGKALDLLNAGLRPFVEREMQSVHGDQWVDEIRAAMRDGRSAPKTKGAGINLDTQALLNLMWEPWVGVFSKTLGRADRTLVSELRDVRNQWAHQESFSTDDAYRALDSAGRLLTAVSAPQADDVEKMKMELLRLRFDEQVRGEKRKAAGTAIESQVTGALKP